jgi:hypothetical protein
VSDIRLSSEAVTELLEAAAWYAAQRPGLEEESLDEEVRVLAVAHTKRRPGYWLDRVRE